MMNAQHQFPSDNEILAAKDVITTFLTSMKNYDLYPHDHVLAQKFLENIHNRLDNFLSRYGELKISIEQKLLLYRAVPIYEVKSGEGNFAFLLYRDGLLWLEFLPGLTLEEIKTLLSILNKYKVLHDEPENDIVTDLWDEDMSHIRYEARELFFDDAPILDFSKLNKGPAEGVESEIEEASGPASPETGNILDMASEEWRHQFCSLSPQEYGTLNVMVREAEKSVLTGDVLQALFFVLSKQDYAEDFDAVLDFFKEEWRTEVEKGNFTRVTGHLTALKKLAESPQQGREWVIELLAGFFEDISDESILDHLKSALVHIDGKNPGQLAEFKLFFLQLEPKVIISLGNLLPYIDSQEILTVLFVAMVKLGRRDITPLGELLVNKDDLIVVRAIQVLGEITGEEPTKLIFQSLQHSSPKVRKQALRSCIAAGRLRLDEIFQTIDDPDATVCAILLSFLSRERNETAEKMLLVYLQSEPRQHMNKNHMLACYKALGYCGSKLSLPFLEKTLLAQAWKSILSEGKIVQQRGAITALTGLQIEEATEVLKNGAASFVPALRKLCRSALALNSEGAYP